jgi:hypothetical protein
MNKTYINALVNQCIEIAIEQKLIRRPKSFEKNLDVKFHNGIGCYGGCWKGQAYVSFGLSPEGWFNPKIKHNREYKRYAKSPYIGSFTTKKSSLVHKATVAHEIAHAIQFWNGNPGKPHGYEWRIIYRKIREVWVNPYINGNESETQAEQHQENDY